MAAASVVSYNLTTKHQVGNPLLRHVNVGWQTGTGIAYLHVKLTFAHQIVDARRGRKHPGDCFPGWDDDLTFEVGANITFGGGGRRGERLSHVVLERDEVGECGNEVTELSNLLARKHLEIPGLYRPVMPSIPCRRVRFRIFIVCSASVG